MIFFKQDIADLIETIEEFYDKDISKLNKFKTFLDYSSWEDIIVNKESEFDLEDFRCRLESIAKDASSGVFDIKKIPRDNLFYYDYIIGGLLLLNEIRETTVLGTPILQASSRTNIDFNKEGDIDLIGFKDILGIPILGFITQVGIHKIFQYFTFENDELVLKTPTHGNMGPYVISDKFGIENIKYDINSNLILESIVNDFYGEETILDVSSTLMLNYLNYFRKDADDLVIDIIDNFIKKYKLV